MPAPESFERDLAGHELIGTINPYLRRCDDHRRPAWHLGRRSLLDYLLVYIADGRGVFTLDGTSYDMEPGDLFWVPPNTPHEMRGFAPSMRCPHMHLDLIYRPQHSHWDFHINQGTIDLSPWSALLHPPVAHPAIAKLRGRIRGHTNRAVGDLIIQISQDIKAQTPFAGLRASGVILEILALILRGTWWLEHATAVRPESMAQAATLLRDQCGDDVNIEEAAEVAGLSASQFRNLFGRHFGCSPRQYLRRARVAKAKQLMDNPAVTLTRIAAKCGFATVHSFSRAFHDVTGMTPSQYRRSGWRPAAP